MGISTTAGAKVYIGTTAAATNATQFAADTYVEIGSVEDIGEFGDESSEVTFSEVGSGRVRKRKGQRDAGTLTLICGRDAADAGQDALLAAEKTEGVYNIKVVADDAPTPGTPSTFYFKAIVLSARLNFGSADNITRVNFVLSIDSAILEIQAASS